MAVSGTRRSEIVACFSNVTIINFNYDRLIEQYIYSELRTRLDVSPHNAAQTVARLKMIRPYGSVSPLPSFAKFHLVKIFPKRLISSLDYHLV